MLLFQDKRATKGVHLTHTVRLSKESMKRLNDDKMKAQIDQIISGVNTADRARRGWHITVNVPQADKYGYHQFYKVNSTYMGYTFHVELTVTCNSDKDRPEDNIETEYQTILRSIQSQASNPQRKWFISQVDGKPWDTSTVEALAQNIKDTVGYVSIEIPEDWDSYFDHLYGLNPHISRVRRALSIAVDTQFNSRFNCALIGDPGCGKSDICRSVKRAVGSDAVLEFDATSTTMAGAQKELNERAENGELPRVLLVEEIEKAQETSLNWLLSLTDLRAEIRKVTARGKIMQDTRMLTIATVNDIDAFKKIAYGALASRFPNQIFFKRPSRETLTRIIEREVKNIQGNLAWVKPAVDYCYDEIQTTDPREAISIALCGRDALLDGTFQKELRETARPITIPFGEIRE